MTIDEKITATARELSRLLDEAQQKAELSAPWELDGEPLIFAFDNGRAFCISKLEQEESAESEELGELPEAKSRGPRLIYRLQATGKYDFARKALLERAKFNLESILDQFSPQTPILIGFDRRHASAIADEAGLGRLKEIGYEIVLKVLPQGNGYLVIEVV